MAELPIVEPFDRTKHDREDFDCGVPALNQYLKTQLRQHASKDLTRGYVLTLGTSQIVGYFTLSAGRLMISAIPTGRGFPTRVPLPSTLLGRLAVDRRFAGRGFGALLLIHALRLAVESAVIIGSAVIEVDAKDAAAQSFYTKYGFRSLPDDPLHMYLAMETARQL